MSMFSRPKPVVVPPPAPVPEAKAPERTRFIEHEGKRILLLDYTSLGSNMRELLEEIAKTKAVIAAQPPGSVLTLTDTRHSQITPGNVRAMKELVEHNEPYVRWGAVVVDLNGVYLAGFRAIQSLTRRRNLLSFGDADEAKDWLVSQP